MLAGKRVHREIFVALVMALFVVAGMSRSAFAQETEWTNYFTNANSTAGQGLVHITDPLENSGPQPEEICAMLYVFDTTQALQECCGCPITADGLLTLNITNDLASNAVAFDGILTDGVIRLLSEKVSYTTATAPGFAQQNPGVPIYYGIAPSVGNANGTDGIGCNAVTGNCCDPTFSESLQPTLRSWASHPLNTALTEEEFEDITTNSTSTDEDNLATLCDDLIGNGDHNSLGTGFGDCTCGIGS